MSVYSALQDMFAPERGTLHASPDPNAQIIDGRTSAFLVGIVAFAMPIALGISTLFGVCFYNTLSHFYYAPFAGGIFIGCLFFIGTFLIAYKGESTAEGIFAGAAGLCAFATALFPTSGSGCECEVFPGRPFTEIYQTQSSLSLRPPGGTAESYFAFTPWANTVHLGAAGTLFVFLAFYCFVIFPRVKADQLIPDTDQLTPVKKRRNRLYFASGLVISGCMLAILVRVVFKDAFPFWDTLNLTFWCESLALFAFGFSWMVKGRFFGYALKDESE
ncbi:MAG: hypothetical protein AAGA36_07190 [Pseudomonadota bacterium]